MFKTIWDMQLDLNKVIGRDTVSDDDKYSWLYDYAQALEDELVELKNCINWKWWAKESKEHGQYMVLMDEKNAKIEAIDSLHFYMSLLHIMDIDDLDFEHPDALMTAANELNIVGDTKVPGIFALCEELLSIVRDIKNATGWTIENFLKDRTFIEMPDEINDALNTGWHLLNLLFYVLGMTPDDILEIYKMKHEKNLKRQENNYSVMNKTEQDNNEIKDQI